MSYNLDCFCDLDNPEPTEPEPVCVNNSPTEMVCGAEGRPGNQCMHKVFSSRVSGFEACKEACKTNNCDSFSYRDENEECEAYQGRVGGTDGLSTPRKWYDVACFNDENTPTDPEPQCVNNLLQSSPKDAACGAMGNPTSQGLEEIGSATTTSVQGCRDACHKEADCDSFQLEEGFNCYLFKGQVGSTDGRTTAELWYDMSCFCDDTKTDPKDPEPVCVNNMWSPSPKDNNCGTEGYPTALDPMPSLGMGDESSLEACSYSCEAISGCKTFQFEQDAWCFLFPGSVGPLDGDSTAMKFYDMSCFCDLNHVIED